MTVSVFIATTPNHIIFLDKILYSYIHKSTIKPDQLVVSISDFPNIDTDLYMDLKSKYQNVLFLEHSEIKLAGPNRQFSKEYCNSDIILYQDSDDLPHIQRIEVVKYFFENYDIVHLHHSYFNLTNYINLIDENNKFNYNEDLINVNTINFIKSENFYNTLFPNKNLLDCRDSNIFNSIFNPFKPHHGAFAIKKEVLDEIKWKDRKDLTHSPKWNDMGYKGAEDYEFMVETIFKFNKTIVIDGKIYFYLG